ncbi:MAG: hypothetical protein NVSMB39_0340 [Candidatus Saccharimonadales bacterium]
MQQSTTTATIGSLLTAIVILTVVISYIPQELNIIRQTLSLVQFGLMAVIMTVTVRAVLRDF